MLLEYSRIFLKVILASKQPSKSISGVQKSIFGSQNWFLNVSSPDFGPQCLQCIRTIPYYCTSMPPMHQNNSILLDLNASNASELLTATTAAAAAAVSQELWTSGGALVQRSQEPNVLFWESLTSIRTSLAEMIQLRVRDHRVCSPSQGVILTGAPHRLQNKASSAFVSLAARGTFLFCRCKASLCP